MARANIDVYLLSIPTTWFRYSYNQLHYLILKLFQQLERKLDEVHKDIAPKAQPHHLHHESRCDRSRHGFLRSVIGTREDRIKCDDFAESVKRWEIPSLEQNLKEAKTII